MNTIAVDNLIRIVVIDKEKRGKVVFCYVGYANPIVAKRNLRL